MKQNLEWIPLDFFIPSWNCEYFG